jgi:hypothetical protein
VEALRGRVRSLDAAYYEAHFVRDPDIAACREGVDRTPPPAPRSAVPGAPGMAAPPIGMEPPPPRSKPGSRGLRAGGYMLGIGVITFGVSAAIVSGASEGAITLGLIGMTAGALLFSIGLITLLISAIIAASAD